MRNVLKEMTSFIVLWVLASSISPCQAAGDLCEPDIRYTGQTIWELPQLRDCEIDLGLWALIVAKEYDKALDIDKHLAQIDELVAVVENGLPTRTDEAIVFITQMVLYQPGHWNGERVFSYDLEDPLGKTLRNKFLSTYLQTRKGNCISMPALYLSLLMRIEPEIQAHAVLAPSHIFCRVHDRQTYRTLIIETTSGQVLRNEESILQKLPIPEEALRGGGYLKDLTKKEFLAELINALVVQERRNNRFDTALKYTNLILELSPRSTNGLVNKGALLHQKGYNLQQKIQREKRQPSAKESELIRWYSAEGQALIEQARELGWQPESPEKEPQQVPPDK